RTIDLSKVFKDRARLGWQAQMRHHDRQSQEKKSLHTVTNGLHTLRDGGSTGTAGARCRRQRQRNCPGGQASSPSSTNTSCSASAASQHNSFKIFDGRFLWIDEGGIRCS